MFFRALPRYKAMEERSISRRGNTCLIVEFLKKHLTCACVLCFCFSCQERVCRKFFGERERIESKTVEWGLLYSCQGGSDNMYSCLRSIVTRELTSGGRLDGQHILFGELSGVSRENGLASQLEVQMEKLPAQLAVVGRGAYRLQLPDDNSK